MSTSKATLILAAEVQTNANLLVREGYLVRKRLGAKAPQYAGMADLMEKLDAGLTDFAHTGLTEEELPVNTWKWCEHLPPNEAAMEAVVEACVQQRGVEIKYVGMRRGETGTWRRLAPLCLERMGDQWRVTAHDLEKEGAPLRTFVLSRILEARRDIAPLPKCFIRANAVDSKTTQPIELNLGFSAVQRDLMQRELKIENGHITLPSRCWHEYLIRFADGARSADIAWPPLRIAR